MCGFGRSRRENFEVIREAYFSAKHTSPQEDSRIPDPDADTGGAGSDRAAPAQRPGAPLRVGRGERQRRESRERLTKPRDFRRVLREGRSRGAGGLVVHVCERGGGAPWGQGDGLGQARLGLVVPRAVGTAVERNRLKRQIRVAWRELRPRTAAVDCVVVVRKAAVGSAFRDLAGHLESCLQSLKVLAPSTATGGTV